LLNKRIKHVSIATRVKLEPDGNEMHLAYLAGKESANVVDEYVVMNNSYNLTYTFRDGSIITISNGKIMAWGS
jgi:hypothetical protein